MSTSGTGPPRLPWYRYLGPWPLRPLAVTVSLAIFYLGVSSGITFLSQRADIQALPRYTFGTVATAAIGGGVIWCFRRLAPTLVQTAGGYALAILVAGAMAVLFRFASGLTPDIAFDQPPFVIPFAFIRAWLLILLTLALLGVAERRLRFQADRAEEALRIAREQQVQILTADEGVREQTSRFLHDRVQARLIAACLELQSIAAARDHDPERVRGVVERLEQLRVSDVRRAARNLSPNLEEVDLLSALEALGAQYRPGMTTTVDVDASIDEERQSIDPRALLGAFRIIEQALLNAAVHGRARNCTVTVHRRGSRIEVVVTDDGVGLPAAPVQEGLGSMLMTLWSRSLDGSWSWSALPGGGTRVTADLAVSPESG